MKRALLAVALLGAGCSLIVGSVDPRDVVPDNPPDLAGGGCGNVQTDPRNCGSCGHDCTRLPGVDPTLVGCTIGVCDLRGACLSARADCSGGYLDGCETDLTTANHCGGCTVQCGGGEPLCARDAFGTFSCTGTCPTTQPTQCGTSCVDLFSDPLHCGSCSHPCTSPTNSVAVCQNGVCGSACNPGFHTCNGFCVDSTSISSCGTACAPCPAAPAHAAEYCDTFAGCSFRCNSGFVLQLGACVAVAPGPDMAGMVPACDCTGLDPDPLGTGVRNQCPITNQCVGNNCCAEDQGGLTGGGNCTDPTPCTTSLTPQ